MADDQAIQDPRALLQEAVKGQDDATLEQFAENLGGVEGFLDLTFQGMTEVVNEQSPPDTTVGWEIVKGDDVHSYLLTIEGGAARVERTDPAAARVTLRLSLPNYMRLIAGELDGMQAFMSGGLQVKGDIMYAAQLQQLFGV